jgi:hypothetical protein
MWSPPCGVKKLGSTAGSARCSARCAAAARVKSLAAAPGNATRGCSSRAGREPTALTPGRTVRACNERRRVLGPSRACQCGADRRGAAVESQGEGTAATADSRGRPGTGQDHGSSAPPVESCLASTPQAAPSGVGTLLADTLPSSPPAGSESRPAPSMLCAWARRNSAQLGPIRRGAGPSPETRKMVATVVAETLIPSFSSSPWIRI